jgi:general secretion pathway protein D
VNADIEAVARTMAVITGRNVVVDPRVKGTITLTTERPVAPGRGLTSFWPRWPAGLYLRQCGRTDKIVPEADASCKAAPCPHQSR